NLGNDQTARAPDDPEPNPPPRAPEASSAPALHTLRQEIRTMLFGDIVGYSKLSEALIPAFVSEFMGRVSQLISDSSYAPLTGDTWGAAAYSVFAWAESARLFALAFTDMIACTPWEDFGLFWPETDNGVTVRRPLSIRIGLHSGPVFVHFEPIVRRLG